MGVTGVQANKTAIVVVTGLIVGVICLYSFHTTSLVGEPSTEKKGEAQKMAEDNTSTKKWFSGTLIDVPESINEKSKTISPQGSTKEISVGTEVCIFTIKNLSYLAT